MSIGDVTTTVSGRAATVRGAFALFVLGMIGVLALAVTTAPTLRGIPGLESASPLLLIALASVNTIIVLVVAVVLGSLTAPHAGLRSNVFAWAAGGDPDWTGVRDSLPLAVGLGALLFVVIAVLDAGFAALSPTATVAGEATLGALAASVPLRLLYGGITEELLLRWGVLAPLAWAGWRVRARFGGAKSAPSAGVLWAAILVSAVAFGAGHLPALAATVDLTPLLVVRTVLLNAIVGVGLGWLFWRRSLETAMIAHASFHVALLAVSTVLLTLA